MPGVRQLPRTLTPVEHEIGSRDGAGEIGGWPGTSTGVDEMRSLQDRQPEGVVRKGFGSELITEGWPYRLGGWAERELTHAAYRDAPPTSPSRSPSGWSFPP